MQDIEYQACTYVVFVLPIHDIMNICYNIEISTLDDIIGCRCNVVHLSSYTQAGGGLLKPKHVHTASFVPVKLKLCSADTVVGCIVL
jgi:hypothetical protein